MVNKGGIMSTIVTPILEVECFICGHTQPFGSGEIYFNKNSYCSEKCLEFVVVTEQNTFTPAGIY